MGACVCGIQTQRASCILLRGGIVTQTEQRPSQFGVPLGEVRTEFNGPTVCRNCVAETSWRRDGKELFYTAADGYVTAVSVKLVDSKLQFGSPETLFQAPPSPLVRRYYDVSADGQRFLVSRATPGSATITVVTNWQSQIGK